MMDVKFKSEALCRVFLKQRASNKAYDLSHKRVYTLIDGNVLNSDSWWSTVVSPMEIDFFFDIVETKIEMGNDSAMMWALEDSEAE